MEAHSPFEDSEAVEIDKLYTKLRKIEKESARILDWDTVKKALAEARGIPVPILDLTQGIGTVAAKTIEVKHPSELYGKPEVPELTPEAWSVLAADVPDEIEAVRLAAIINHQGPQIPARVVPKYDSYRVVVGPFNNVREANAAIKRLKIDLEIASILIEPVKTK